MGYNNSYSSKTIIAKNKVNFLRSYLNKYDKENILSNPIYLNVMGKWCAIFHHSIGIAFYIRIGQTFRRGTKGKSATSLILYQVINEEVKRSKELRKKRRISEKKITEILIKQGGSMYAKKIKEFRSPKKIISRLKSLWKCQLPRHLILMKNVFNIINDSKIHPNKVSFSLLFVEKIFNIISKRRVLTHDHRKVEDHLKKILEKKKERKKIEELEKEKENKELVQEILAEVF